MKPRGRKLSTLLATVTAAVAVLVFVCPLRAANGKMFAPPSASICQNETGNITAQHPLPAKCLAYHLGVAGLLESSAPPSQLLIAGFAGAILLSWAAILLAPSHALRSILAGIRRRLLFYNPTIKWRRENKFRAWLEFIGNRLAASIA